MMNFESDERNLPQKISEDIISFILNEHLQPGDKLPNEAHLAKELNIGRSSLREAMKLLASRNIVTIRQGSGTYVASSPGVVDDPLGFTFIPDKKKLVQDLLEVRFLLEPAIAAMSATYADNNDIKKIVSLCDEVEELLKQKKDHTQKDIEFHSYLAKLSGNMVVERLIPVINTSVVIFANITYRSLMQETLETHRAIVNSIEHKDPVGAKCAMNMHLTYNRQVIMELLEKKKKVRKNHEPDDI